MRVLAEEAGFDPNKLRPAVLDISLDALETNFKAIEMHAAGSVVMPILKANAYGHGLVPTARLLESLGAKIFGVAFLDEAVILRRAGISVPILALGGICGRQIEGFLKYDVQMTASSVMKLRVIEETAAALGKTAQIHLKIDTGLGRIGQQYTTAYDLFSETLRSPHCQICGVFSHFADSEGEDLSFAELQLERFLECLRFFEKHSLPCPTRHIANSGAIVQLPDSYLDLIRPGLLLYGINPVKSGTFVPELTRALKLSSEVVYFKAVKKGSSVSYGRTWEAKNETRIVTIPVGYGDGYSRRLSNSGHVLIRGARFPIAGRICMDQFMVDIGSNGTAYNGDEVVLIGEQGKEKITVEEISALVDTDPRDVLLTLNLRLPRRFSYQGEYFWG